MQFMLAALISMGPERAARAVAIANEATLLAANWSLGLGSEAEALRMSKVYTEAVTLLEAHGTAVFQRDRHAYALLMVSRCRRCCGRPARVRGL